MNNSAITVDNLGKQYRINVCERNSAATYKSLREVLMRTLAAPVRILRNDESSAARTETIWALRHVSFEVTHGEVVGIIGRNGAGKSTLLKLLSRVTEPSEGAARVRGRVGSLLEVGTGFHPELNGRDNVFLSGAILGMRKREIAARFDEIVSFAEIDTFLDTPVKHYSSGMYMRLAFAVAAHLNPEVLMVDEVLAVGDAAFQKKCLGKMEEVAKSGRTVIFVSHNMAAIQQLTTRAVLLHHGRIVDHGETARIVSKYLKRSVKGEPSVYTSFKRNQGVDLARQVEFVAFTFARASDRIVAFDQHLHFQAQLRGNREVRAFRLSMTIFTIAGTPVGACFGPQTCSIRSGELAWFSLRIDQHSLAPGTYYCDFGVGVGTPETGILDFDQVREVLHFEVMPPLTKEGLRSSWVPNWGSVIFKDVQVRKIVEECAVPNKSDDERCAD